MSAAVAALPSLAVKCLADRSILGPVSVPARELHEPGGRAQATRTGLSTGLYMVSSAGWHTALCLFSFPGFLRHHHNHLCLLSFLFVAVYGGCCLVLATRHLTTGSTQSATAVQVTMSLGRNYSFIFDSTVPGAAAIGNNCSPMLSKE